MHGGPGPTLVQLKGRYCQGSHSQQPRPPVTSCRCVFAPVFGGQGWKEAGVSHCLVGGFIVSLFPAGSIAFTSKPGCRPYWQRCFTTRVNVKPQLGQICASEAATLLCTLLSAHVRCAPPACGRRLLTLVLKSTGPLPSCVEGGGGCRQTPLPWPLRPSGPALVNGQQGQGPGPLGLGSGLFPALCQEGRGLEAAGCGNSREVAGLAFLPTGTRRPT